MKSTRTMTATMGMIGAIVLCAAGCTVKTGGTHTLVANADETVLAGECARVEGPYAIPDGAVASWSVFDDNADNMAIAVIDDGASCDPAGGFAYSNSTGSMAGSEIVPGSTYDLAILCLNAIDTCIPTLDYWQYDD